MVGTWCVWRGKNTQFHLKFQKLQVPLKSWASGTESGDGLDRITFEDSSVLKRVSESAFSTSSMIEITFPAIAAPLDRRKSDMNGFTQSRTSQMTRLSRSPKALLLNVSLTRFRRLRHRLRQSWSASWSKQRNFVKLSWHFPLKSRRTLEVFECRKWQPGFFWLPRGFHWRLGTVFMEWNQQSSMSDCSVYELGTIRSRCR